ncbi:MAG TPA: hypothetical protein VGK34_03360 [Armatimonadota bacterium]|jgi:hypothetical protein
MSFMNRLFSRKPKDTNQAFWQWFIAHSAELLDVTTCQEDICGELYAQMKIVHKGLVYAFGPETDGKREFIVSADGIKTVFPAVLTLVNSAPDIPRWRIIAFRPAAGWGIKMQMGDTAIGAEDIWYMAEEDDGRVNLVLFIRNSMMESDLKTAKEIAFLLLDFGLGEYIVETKIGSIDFQPLPDDPLPSSLNPLPELSAAVNRLIR